jgi:hypothetical protein
MNRNERLPRHTICTDGTGDAPRSQTMTRPSDDGAEESTHDPYRDEGGES